MLKKLILFVIAVLPVTMQAQLAVGSWNLYSPYRNVDRMVETGDYVYYMSEGALTRVDKEYGEVQVLNTATLLNDSDVKNIYVDTDGRSVLVTYGSSNMDRLYDDGRVVNMSDIKDAVMTQTRDINGVDFSDKFFVVGTDFGVVIYNSDRNEVERTVYSSYKVTDVVAVGDYVGATFGNQIMFAKNDRDLTAWSGFKSMPQDTGKFGWKSLKGLGDKYVLAVNGSAQLYKITLDFDNRVFTPEVVKDAAGAAATAFNTSIDVCSTGAYACNDKGAYVFAKDGSQSFRSGVVRTSEKLMSHFANGASAWRGDASGVALVNVSSGAVEMTTAKPSTLTVSTASAMHVGASGKVYVYNLGEKIGLNLDRSNRSKTYVNVVSSGGKFTDVTPVDVEINNNNSSNNLYTPTAPHHVSYGYYIYEDPTDADAYYIGSLFEGCYRIKNGKQTHKYDQTNTPIVDFSTNWGKPVAVPLVDRTGNLWLFQFANEGDFNANRIHYLPASKRGKTDVKITDWVSKPVPNMKKDYRDPVGLACKTRDYVVLCPGQWNNTIVIINYKGTESAADDRIITVTDYVDQDNKSLSTYHVRCIAEDNDGKIWVGTESGVFEITDISKVTSSTAVINHLKVPRNDGTGLADYLLDGLEVYAISVDSTNRKWIATNSGVYYVSADGSEILEHYTSNNSMLPSDVVYSVAADPKSNSVFFGTSQGVVEYNSTTSPGSESYENVVAYPNPVRPDYTGWITIKGLMEDSLVKISDAYGNVLHQGRSNGGMYVWDGCMSNGERVRTGVYYVLASSGSAEVSGDAVVTKIMVVN